MSIRTVRLVVISCDWSGCDLEDSFDPPRPDAMRAARAAGWAISHDVGTKRAKTARCPNHRNQHLATSSEPAGTPK